MSIWSLFLTQHESKGSIVKKSRKA